MCRQLLQILIQFLSLSTMRELDGLCYWCVRDPREACCVTRWDATTGDLIKKCHFAIGLFKQTAGLQDTEKKFIVLVTN